MSIICVIGLYDIGDFLPSPISISIATQYSGLMILNTIVSSVGNPSLLKHTSKHCDSRMNTITIVHLYGSSDFR